MCSWHTFSNYFRGKGNYNLSTGWHWNLQGSHFSCPCSRLYHFLQVRGYTSFRAVTPMGRTKGWVSVGWVLVLLGPDWQLSEQAPCSGPTSSAALELAQAPSALSLTVVRVDLARSSASLCISSWTPSTSRDSSSMFCCCSKSGRTIGRLRSMSSVSWPAGTLGSPCKNE